VISYSDFMTILMIFFLMPLPTGLAKKISGRIRWNVRRPNNPKRHGPAPKQVAAIDVKRSASIFSSRCAPLASGRSACMIPQSVLAKIAPNQSVQRRYFVEGHTKTTSLVAHLSL